MTALSNSNVIIRVPRTFLWAIFGALVAQVIAGVWFAAAMTSDLRHVGKEIAEHQILGAHPRAGIRLITIETVMRAHVEEEKSTLRTLNDIRNLLENRFYDGTEE